MILNTKYHGPREYNEQEVIHFKNGIPGFETLTKFILFPVEDNEVFSILHSIEHEEIGLVVVSPFYVDPSYEFSLNEEILQRLEIAQESDVLVLNSVTLHSKIEQITVNMKAPFIINNVKRVGEQTIIDKDNYLIKHPLIQG